MRQTFRVVLMIGFASMIASTVAQSAGEDRILKVDAGGHRLNLVVRGVGSPAIVLESGMAGFAAGWTKVFPEIARLSQVVAYDRAGFGASEPGPKPRTAKQIASELHLALKNAGIPPPYLMVGHSMGGLYVRVFADVYPHDVAGMVLVDPSQEDYIEWIETNYPELIAQDDRIIKTQAPEAAQGEWAIRQLTRDQARAAHVPPGIPVTLLTAMLPYPGLTAAQRKVWVDAQRTWLTKVPGGRLILAEKSGHAIQDDEPALLVDAVKEVADAARKTLRRSR